MSARSDRLVVSASIAAIALTCIALACIRGLVAKPEPRDGPRVDATTAEDATAIAPDVHERATCASRSLGHGGNTLDSRRWSATSVSFWLERLHMRRATADAVGPGWTTMRLGNMPRCDNETLQRVLNSHDPNAPLNVDLMCAADGFASIECEPAAGQRRTINIESICDCEVRGFLGGWCACSFDRAP